MPPRWLAMTLTLQLSAINIQYVVQTGEIWLEVFQACGRKPKSSIF